MSAQGVHSQLSAVSFAAADLTKQIILSASFPLTVPTVFFVEKVALRWRFSHSLVNLGASVTLQSNSSVVASAVLVMAGLPGAAKELVKTEKALVSADVSQAAVWTTLAAVLSAEVAALMPGDTPQASYRLAVSLSLFYKLILHLQSSLPPALKSAVTPFLRPISSGHQTFQNPGDPSENPVSYPEPKLTESAQVTGRAVYAGDEPLLPGTLFAAPVYSSVAVASLLAIDPTNALALPGVTAFLSSKDLPDPTFSWGAQLQDEPLFASASVSCAGQLIGVVVAESQLLADMGSRLVSVSYGPPATPILTIDEAISAKSFYPASLIPMPLPLVQGDVATAFAASAHVLEGEQYMGGQTHFHMEPQTWTAIPEPNDSLRMVGAYQDQQFVLQVVAGALQMPQSKIIVQTRRIGGAYGAKILRPAGLSAATALAARKLGRPVQMVMRLEFQGDMIGKRNPFKSTYKIGYENSGKINAVDITLYQQGGAFLDGDVGSLMACISTISNVYAIDNWSINGVLCKTNVPAQASTRGPGWTNGCVLSEALFENVALALNMDPLSVKQINFAAVGSVTPYGQKFTYYPTATMLAQLQASAGWTTRLAAVSEYNKTNRWTKRGLACVPARFNV